MLMNVLWACVVVHAQTLREVMRVAVLMATSKVAHNALILMNVKMDKTEAVNKYATTVREVTVVIAVLAIA
jgi:hypothetical protein